MTKSGVIRCMLSVVLTVYLVMALLISNDMAAREMCRGLEVKVEHNTASRNFVTPDEVRRLLHEWGLDNVNGPASAVDLQKIEDSSTVSTLSKMPWRSALPTTVSV